MRTASNAWFSQVLRVLSIPEWARRWRPSCGSCRTKGPPRPASVREGDRDRGVPGGAGGIRRQRVGQTCTSKRAGCRTPCGAGPGTPRGVACVIQLHRWREVVTLAGFTRFERRARRHCAGAELAPRGPSPPTRPLPKAQLHPIRTLPGTAARGGELVQVRRWPVEEVTPAEIPARRRSPLPPAACRRIVRDYTSGGWAV